MLCAGVGCGMQLLFKIDHLPLALGLGAILGVLAWLVVAMLVLVRKGKP